MTGWDRSFGVHVCALDRDCYKYAPDVWRLEVHTPWFHLGLALEPDSRYVSADEQLAWYSWSKP